MPRIFASLAIANLVLFALTAVIASIDTGSAPDRHVLLGIGTLLLSCFIQVVGFTYLTVTGKVIAQAAHLASLAPACLRSAKHYKRSFTRNLALAIVSVVIASASGGAAWRSDDALPVHIPAAALVAIIHFWIYRRQHHVLCCNAHLVETTLTAYSSWRTRQISPNISHAASDESNALVR